MSSENTEAVGETTHSGDNDKASSYAWGVAFALMAGYAISFLDREVLSLLIQPIKAQFDLTDFQVSLLLGPAFAVFYTVMGVPLGWAADRYNRTKLIAAGMSLWSVMTAFCGLSANFTQIFLARMGVGVGEACLTPSAVSLLSDYFPKSKLPIAMSIYSIGLFLGKGLALIGGGYVLTLLMDVNWSLPGYGKLEYWQIGFLLAATPGIILALVVLAIREPKRKEMAVDSEGNPQQASFKVAFKYLLENKKLFLSLFLGGSMVAILQYQGLWYPELFMRNMGMEIAEAGRSTGIPTVLGGITGLLLGGYYMNKQASKGIKDTALKLAFISTFGTAIPAVLIPLMPNASLMMVGIFLMTCFVAMPLICGTTAIRMTVP
ncbi:MAG: MFS transporter, partial [Emcibacteraceae bacterium]|nr:MFS transporter [Emcibacteraceae bacterium]